MLAVALPFFLFAGFRLLAAVPPCPCLLLNLFSRPLSNFFLLLTYFFLARLLSTLAMLASGLSASLARLSALPLIKFLCSNAVAVKKNFVFRSKNILFCFQ